MEFGKNYWYQASLNMITFDVLYGRKCNIPVIWDTLYNGLIVGRHLHREMEEKMVKIKQNSKAT